MYKAQEMGNAAAMARRFRRTASLPEDLSNRLPVPRVRILPSPPNSLYYLPTIWRCQEIGACRGAFALDANRRKLSRQIRRIPSVFSL